MKNSSLHNVRKMFEVFPKIFLLSQKNYLHTFMYSFVAPGNYSDFLQNLEAKIQISREKNCAWCTTINFYLQICSKVSYCLMCIILYDLYTQGTLYFTFFVSRVKNEKNRNLAGFKTGFEKKKM